MNICHIFVLFVGAMLPLKIYGQAAIPVKERNEQYWNDIGRSGLEEAQNVFNNLNTNTAKNVIAFIGDGMSLSTVVAGRILKGQRKSSSNLGEETVTSLDRMHHSGLLKTYSIDHQTPDSAATATAYLCGVKTRSSMLGVSAHAFPGNCQLSKGNEVSSILERCAAKGKSTGIVTTTRVQHATPAGAYAKTPSRSWYSDSDIPLWQKRRGCRDIAHQLVAKGNDINVILGGGRAHMRPKGFRDEEYANAPIAGGDRLDGRDLIKQWIAGKPVDRASYVWNKKQFDEVDPESTDYLMGLFDPFEMHFALDREDDIAGEPSLAEMTEKAIKVLQKNDKGYFLLVESGMLDKGHHLAKAHYALEEFLELEKAVAVAQNLTSNSETLIIVTADHGHVFTIGGGTAKRGNPIFGLGPSDKNPKRANDGNYYTTLGYANGPGGFAPMRRPEIDHVVAGDKDHRFQAAVPMHAESHSAEDVVVLASGPMSHMVTGVHEQNYIAHVMDYAACVGDTSQWKHCQTTNAGKVKSSRQHDEMTFPERWEEISEF